MCAQKNSTNPHHMVDQIIENHIEIFDISQTAFTKHRRTRPIAASKLYSRDAPIFSLLITLPTYISITPKRLRLSVTATPLHKSSLK
jgi:hypothetical protein